MVLVVIANSRSCRGGRSSFMNQSRSAGHIVLDEEAKAPTKENADPLALTKESKTS